MEKSNRVNAKTRRIVAPLIIALAIGAIVLGVLWGEVRIVLQKATTICLECIGLG
ncbi:MAG: CD1871A family CXXC motif-containing protein [Sphaerochaetaceae bacterium]|jgi:hypothetical protein